MAQKSIHIVNEEKSEICIFGYIGGYDTVNWNQFQSDFNDMAKNSSEITIRINSNGGDMIEGFAMYDTIRNSGVNVTGIVEGIAASMAGIIFLACDKRLMNENSRLMIHRPRGFCSGEKENFETYVDLIQQEEDKLINALMDRSGQKLDTVKGWLKPGSQTWMDAKTAIKNGLADEMVKSAKKIKITNSLLENIEEAIGIYNSIQSEDKPISMKKILTVLSAFNIVNSLSDESTDSQVAEVVENALKARDTKIQELQAKLDEQGKKAVENALDSAVKDGRITAEQKADWKPVLENNLENGLKLLGNLSPRVDVNSIINKNTPNGGVVNGIPSDRKDWNIRKWETEDPTGLENMLKNNPQEFERLSKEYYGA